VVSRNAVTSNLLGGGTESASDILVLMWVGLLRMAAIEPEGL